VLQVAAVDAKAEDGAVEAPTEACEEVRAAMEG
jgi:hypothetical protein